MPKLLLFLLLIVFILFFSSLSKVFRNLYDLTKYQIIGSYNEIIPNLWIGDYHSSINHNFLLENNIKTVINCSKNLKFVEFKNLNKLRIPIDDNRSNESNKKMLEYFEKFYDIIDQSLKNNEGVLVHCRMGCQRSATLIALYLMKKNNINFKQARKIIRSKRYYALYPFINFHKILL